MINLEDIEDMTSLTRAEIEAIALHEHISEGDATFLGEYLLHIHKGPQRVHAMICDDIRDALHRDDTAQARKLFATLRDFIAEHPEAERGSL